MTDSRKTRANVNDYPTIHCGKKGRRYSRTNRQSNAIAENLLQLAASYVPQSPVIALKIYLGVEKYFGHLNRSDHAPFWKAGIPTIMWTDTSEFRNPHYHRATDTADTLDYDFMSQVTKLALARAASRAWQ